jgi:hypothetical protein
VRIGTIGPSVRSVTLPRIDPVDAERVRRRLAEGSPPPSVLVNEGDRLTGLWHARWRVLRGKPFDEDPTHCQYFSYDSLRKLLEEFLTVEEVLPLKGRLARYSMRLFARNVAFRCRKS